MRSWLPTTTVLVDYLYVRWALQTPDSRLQTSSRVLLDTPILAELAAVQITRLQQYSGMPSEDGGVK